MADYQKREDWIDLLKGIGIVLVVLGHSIEYVEYTRDGVNVIWKFADFWLSSFHMPLFFFCSAYLQRKKEMSLERYEKRDIYNKTISLLIPYSVFSIIFVLSKVVFSNSIQNSVSIRDCIMIWLFPLSTLWFLYLLLCFFLCRVLIYNMHISQKMVLFLSLMLCLTSYYLSLPLYLNNTVVLRFLKYGMYYSLGIVIFDMGDRIKDTLRKKNILIALIIGVLFLLSFSYKYKIKWLMPFLAVSEIFLAMSICLKKQNSIFLSFGKNSLGIYLIHDYFVCLSVILLNRIGLRSDFIILVSFAISLLCSFVIYRFVLAVPVLSWAIKPTCFLAKRYSNEYRAKD